MKPRWLAALLVAWAFVAHGAAPEARQHTEDFDAAWRAIDTRYAYMDRRAAWRRVREVWRPRAARARSREEFIGVLDRALAELRDDHISLSERAPASTHRIPADTDIWAVWRDGVAVVEAVRTFGDADVAGLRPGHVIARIDGVPVERAVRERLGPAPAAIPGARDWALRQALAGPRNGTLRLEVREGAVVRSLDIERKEHAAAHGPPLIGRRMGEGRDLGYIRLKQPLADMKVVEHFDGALNYLKDTRALILDLREMSGPGRDEVTRAILGRFVRTESPWQLRELAGRRVTDMASPRGNAPYRAPVLVLVDRWTAGEGEALAAGLNAVAKAQLVGTAMAGLRGELGEEVLPHSRLVVRFPTQKAFHPNGTPRELLRPDIPVNLAAPQGGPGDPILYQALKLLAR